MAVQTVPNYLRVRIRYGAAVAMLLLAWVLSSLPVMEDFERTLYDWRVRLAVAQDKPHDDIVIVGIDDESLDTQEKEFVRWPWPRGTQGVILDYCSLARAVGVDILYSERQFITLKDELGDRPLIVYVQKNGAVTLAANFLSEEFSDSPEPEGIQAFALKVDEGAGEDILTMDWVQAPFPELLAVVAAVGHVIPNRDADDKIRKYQAVVRYRGKIYPSLAVATAALYRGVDLAEVRLDADNVLHIGECRMALDRQGGFLFSPLPKDAYPVHSAWDVLISWTHEKAMETPSVSRDAFDGKIVLFGMIADTVRDHEITPLPGAMPGVLIHAAAVQNLLEQTSFRIASPWLKYTLMILLALVPAIPRLERPRTLLAMGAGLLLLYVVVAVGCAYGSRLMLPLMGPVLANGLSCAALQGMYWGQERARRKYFETLEVAKQQFTDMLVHDLKNTVAPIIMSLTLVDDKMDLDAEMNVEDIRFWRKDFPEIVATSANKLMTQINALLDIRRMQEGRLQLHTAPHDPNRLIQRVAEQYRVAAERTDLRIEVTQALDGGSQVVVDAEVFDRILGNLVWNAVKYARQGTAIEIGCRLAEEGMIEFFVGNHGRPIPEEAQEHLFMAFVSGRDLAKDRKAMPSTGLGLTFCKLATEAHGGEIRLRSPATTGGDGVIVTLRFPQSEEPTPSESPVE